MNKLFLAAAMVLSLFLAACGGGKEGAVEVSAPTPVAAAAPAASAPAVVASAPQPAPTFVTTSVVGGGVGGMCGAIKNCGAGEPSATITWNAESDGTCGTPPLTVSACPTPQGH